MRFSNRTSGWVNGLVVLSICLYVSGCSGPLQTPEGQTTEPETVMLSTEKIAGPGGTLVYEGQEITGDIEVPANALLGAAKAGDEEVYLYHPALGDEELSIYNSRRAVGYFIEGLASDTESQAKFIEQYSGIFGTAKLDDGSYNSSNSKIVPIKNNTRLATGMTVYAEDKEHCTITNATKRWVALNIVAGEGPFFLPPRNDAPLGTDLLTLFDQRFFGRVVSTPRKELTGSHIKTYASVVRAMPGIWFIQPDNFVQYLKDLPGWIKRLFNIPSEPTSPADKQELELQWQLLKATIEEAKANDETLFLQLNMIDFGHFTIEGLKALLGVAMTSECKEMIFNAILLNIGETLWIGVLTGETDDLISFAKESVKQLLSALALCGLEKVPLPAVGVVSKTTSRFLDILCAFAWVMDWQKGQTDTFKYSAFDSVQFGDELPWNSAHVVVRNIKLNMVSPEGGDYWDLIHKDWHNISGNFHGNTFHGSFKSQRDAMELRPDSRGNVHITIDPDTFEIDNFTVSNEVTDYDGGNPSTFIISGKNIPVIKKHSWDHPPSKWFECGVNGANASDFVTEIEYTRKQGGKIVATNKKYSNVKEILKGRTDSEIYIEFRQNPDE